MLRKIIIVQCRPGRRLNTDEILHIFRQKPDYMVLPEYQGVDPLWRDTAYNSERAEDYQLYCRNLADNLGVALIAGTTVEEQSGRYFNTCPVYNRGELVGKYRKINPTANERKHGISPGSTPSLFRINEVNISVLICADVLHSENFDRLAELQPDIIFIPTTSPFKPGESAKEKYQRDEQIFVAGAKTTGSYLVKCCAVGNLWGGQLQGRSLVAAPWGVITRIQPQEEDRERILSIVLDITELREFRIKRGLPLSSNQER